MKWKDTLPALMVAPSLTVAARMIVWAMEGPGGQRSMRIAAAHIRAVRKQIEAEYGITSKQVGDWHPGASDERILWGVLYRVAEGAYYGADPYVAGDCLRVAESGLRTLDKRHRGQA